MHAQLHQKKEYKIRNNFTLFSSKLEYFSMYVYVNLCCMNYQLPDDMIACAVKY